MSGFHKDFTEGNVTSLLIRFSIPFLIANILQALYGVVDMIIVGQIVDTATSAAGTSALNISSQIMIMANSVIIGLSTGGTILIAQFLGARDHDKIEHTIGTFLTVFSLFAIGASVILFALAEPLLRALNTPETAFEGALSYLRVCAAGMIFSFGYNALGAILRGMGDSKRPMYFVIVATVTNVLLDLLFVGPMRMGVFGAGLATVIAQALSFVLAAAYLVRGGFVFDFKPASFKVNREILSLLLRLGLPSGLQQGIVQSSFLVLSSIINTYGESASSAAGIAGKIGGFAVLPALAIMTAIASMAGQNIGAGFYDRARKTMFTGMKLLTPLIVVITAAVFLFADGLIRIFTPNPEVIAIGVSYLRVCCLEYVVVSVLFCMGGLITGAGYPSVALINTLISSFILRVPLAYLLSAAMGLQGIALTIVISPFGALIYGGIFLLSGKWKHSRIVKAPPEQPGEQETPAYME